MTLFPTEIPMVLMLDGEPKTVSVPFESGWTMRETFTGQLCAVIDREPGAWAFFTLPCHEPQIRWPHYDEEPEA